MRVLLVEPKTQRSRSIGSFLQNDGINVEFAEGGEDALHLMRAYDFDLVLLDLRLADIDRSAAISRIRRAKHETPIIAFSSMPQARLKALTAGADDIVERDIDPAELSARIRAVVRRSRGFSHSQLYVGDFVLDLDHQDVVANGVRVHFTPKEFAVLELLVLRRNMIMTKEAILGHLYCGMDEPEIKIIDVFICKIRSKLAKAGMPTIISTVWGRGYSVKDTRHSMPAIFPRPLPVGEEVFA